MGLLKEERSSARRETGPPESAPPGGSPVCRSPAFFYLGQLGSKSKRRKRDSLAATAGGKGKAGIWPSHWLASSERTDEAANPAPCHGRMLMTGNLRGGAHSWELPLCAPCLGRFTPLARTRSRGKRASFSGGRAILFGLFRRPARL